MRSFRQAVNAKCRDCIYDPQQPGTWRMQVEGCQVPECPLYELRPRPTMGGSAEKTAKTGDP